MARTLVVNGVTYPDVESLTLTDADGEEVVYVEEGASGSSGGEEEIPDDGKTRIFIHLAEHRKNPVLGCCPNGTVTVDWGDGTDPVTLKGTSVSTLVYTDPHEYSEPGDYVITLTVDGNVGLRGTNCSALLVASSTASDVDLAYLAAIKKVVCGDGITTLGSYAFAYCHALASVSIPNITGTIGSSAFRFCYALSSITIPNTVTRINTLAFSECYGVRYYDFSAYTRVPTLQLTNAFTLIPDDCEILVPAALYDEWIAATNWSTYADHIVAV